MRNLSSSELGVVRDYAATLIFDKRRTGSAGGANSKSKTSKKTQKPKGANKVSPYLELPEFKNFSEAESRMKSVVKETGRTLKELLEDQPRREEISAFLRARETWFPVRDQFLADHPEKRQTQNPPKKPKALGAKASESKSR